MVQKRTTVLNLKAALCFFYVLQTVRSQGNDQVIVNPGASLYPVRPYPGPLLVGGGIMHNPESYGPGSTGFGSGVSQSMGGGYGGGSKEGGMSGIAQSMGGGYGGAAIDAGVSQSMGGGYGGINRDTASSGVAQSMGGGYGVGSRGTGIGGVSQSMGGGYGEINRDAGSSGVSQSMGGGYGGAGIEAGVSQSMGGSYGGINRDTGGSGVSQSMGGGYGGAAIDAGVSQSMGGGYGGINRDTASSGVSQSMGGGYGATDAGMSGVSQSMGGSYGGINRDTSSSGVSQSMTHEYGGSSGGGGMSNTVSGGSTFGSFGGSYGGSVFPHISCPEVFSYKNDINLGGWYGLVVTPKSRAQQEFDLEVNMTINKAVAQNDNIKLNVVSTQDEIFNGDAIKWSIRFPYQDMLPKLTQVKFNQQVTCSNQPDPLVSGVTQTAMWAKAVIRTSTGAGPQPSTGFGGGAVSGGGLSGAGGYYTGGGSIKQNDGGYGGPYPSVDGGISQQM